MVVCLHLNDTRFKSISCRVSLTWLSLPTPSAWVSIKLKFVLCCTMTTRPALKHTRRRQDERDVMGKRPTRSYCNTHKHSAQRASLLSKAYRAQRCWKPTARHY